MKPLKITTVLITACIALCVCSKQEEKHRYVTFINKSGENIGCQLFWSENVTNTVTPYTCSYTDESLILKDSIYLYECPDRDSCWESSFNYISFLQITIMDGDTYEQSFKASCNLVHHNILMLYRYQLLLKDLQRMNWTVVYPPEK